jgi:polyribonucleotide nucleotidyltransferase
MTEVEVLTSRLIDRPSRPLFPKGWRFDTQVIRDGHLDRSRERVGRAGHGPARRPALHLSDIPWAGPYAGVRIGRVGGKLVVNPTFTERAQSDSI